MKSYFAINVSGMVVEGRLRLSFTYNKYEHKRNHIRQLLTHYRSNLVKIIRHCTRKEKVEITPSDLVYPDLTIQAREELQNRVSERVKGAEIENIYPLAPMQSGILFHYLMDPSTNAYFEQNVISLAGEIDKDRLKKSFALLIEAHDIFRTLFYHEGGEQPLQVVLKQGNPDIYFEDITVFPGLEREKYFLEARRRDLEKKFNLTGEFPMRVSLFRTGSDTYRLIWSFHHILMDGWSLGIAFKELVQVYQKLTRKEPVRLVPVVPFGNYLEWLTKRDKKTNQEFWRQYLRGYERPAVLPGIPSGKTDDKGDKKYELNQHSFSIGECLTGNLTKIARDNRVTINNLFRTIWGILLHRYNNTDDVVFGSVVSAASGN